MKLFLNNIKINIKKDGTTVNRKEYDHIFSTFDKIELSDWKGKVLLLFPSSVIARKFFDSIEAGMAPEVVSVTIICHKPKDFVLQSFKDFNFIDAGGGIVTNKENKILMIYRNGIWDFPKGKLDKGEKLIDCAEREVNEECGVKVKAINLICKTRHTYIGSKKRIFKTTYWYAMDLISDSKMKPQAEEGIEKVEWKSLEEVNELLDNSFVSLKYLFNKAYKAKGTYALTSLSNL